LREPNLGKTNPRVTLFICLRFVLHHLSRELVYISNANPACSCVYICKFQFRPIHPPSRRLSPRTHGQPLGRAAHAWAGGRGGRREEREGELTTSTTKGDNRSPGSKRGQGESGREEEERERGVVSLFLDHGCAGEGRGRLLGTHGGMGGWSAPRRGYFSSSSSNRSRSS
jgi:hypothetical protein